MKRIAAAVLETLPALVVDAAGLAGGIAIAYGALLAYRPAGFIVGGALLLAGAWLSARSA